MRKAALVLRPSAPVDKVICLKFHKICLLWNCIQQNSSLREGISRSCQKGLQCKESVLQINTSKKINLLKQNLGKWETFDLVYPDNSVCLTFWSSAILFLFLLILLFFLCFLFLHTLLLPDKLEASISLLLVMICIWTTSFPPLLLLAAELRTQTRLIPSSFLECIPFSSFPGVCLTLHSSFKTIHT